jgi:hypothetical protein
VRVTSSEWGMRQMGPESLHYDLSVTLKGRKKKKQDRSE